MANCGMVLFHSPKEKALLLRLYFTELRKSFDYSKKTVKDICEIAIHFRGDDFT